MADANGKKATKKNRAKSWLRGLSLFLLGVVGLSFLVMSVITPLGLTAQMLLSAMLFALALILNRMNGRFVSLMLITISVIVSSRYIYWRIFHTLGGDWDLVTIMGPLLLFAELYAFFVLLLGYLQGTWPLPRRPAKLPESLDEWPTLDIFIPTYNEPLRVVRATTLAAMQIDWPADKLKVYILDDGRRAEFRKFAQKAGVGYLTRADNKHAKAGNINLAMTKTKGDFIAFFDCDHVPTRSFAQLTVGWMLKDENIAMVQTPHHFYSPDPFERNLDNFRKVPNEGELFYGLVQPSNDLWNGVFFCGSCAVLRRQALEEIGGVAVETVTEDAHTALKFHKKGWQTAYLNIPQAAGLATESLSAHVGQRIRWARGMAQIFRLDNPILARGLTLVQRLCYTSAMIHFFYGLPRLIFMLAPLSYMIFRQNIFNAEAIMVVTYAFPHLMHAGIANGRVQGKYRHGFWATIYEAVLAFYIFLPTTLALISPKIGSFNVTAKGGLVHQEYFDRKIALPYIVLLLLNITGIGFGLYWVLTDQVAWDSLALNGFWAMHNIMVLGTAIAVAWERKQVRHTNRIDLKLPAMLRYEDEFSRTATCETVNISQGGLAVTGLENFEFKKDEPVSISVFLNYEELPLAGRVTRDKHHGESELNIKFDTLTIQEEEWLVRVMFSRRNAWTDWAKTRTSGKFFESLKRVLGYAASGLTSLGRGLRSSKPAASRKGA